MLKDIKYLPQKFDDLSEKSGVKNNKISLRQLSQTPNERKIIWIIFTMNAYCLFRFALYASEKQFTRFQKTRSLH